MTAVEKVNNTYYSNSLLSHGSTGFSVIDVETGVENREDPTKFKLAWKTPKSFYWVDDFALTEPETHRRASTSPITKVHIRPER